MMKNLGMAALLSFFITGLGQMYNGQIFKGLMFLLAAGISLALTALSVGLFLLLPLWGWSIYDAYQRAARINKAAGPYRGKVTGY